MSQNNNYKNNRNYSNRQKIDTEVQKLLNDFLTASIANNKSYSTTVTDIAANLNEIAEGNKIAFNGLKLNQDAGGTSSHLVLDKSQALTPVMFTLTERIDLGRIYGKMLYDDEEVLGDIYDEYELRQLIEDVCAKYYSLYYVEDMPDDKREQSYIAVVELLGTSLALYSLIVCAWSYQNMKQGKLNIADINGGSIARLFSPENYLSPQETNVVYPYATIANVNNSNVPFQWVFSNADWLQLVISHLEDVWLPEQTASFWREIFGAVYLLQNNPQVDRGAIQMVKFLPQFTYNFDNYPSDDNLYNKLVYSNTVTKDDFLTMLDSLSNSIKSKISKYPWMTSVLASLGCNFHGFKYYLDGNGNINSEKCDDFTRSLIAKNINMLYDKNGLVHGILQANSLINLTYATPEATESGSFAYNYVPFETVIDDKYAARMHNIFDCIVIADVHETAFYNPTSFAELLRGNVQMPVLHAVVLSKTGTNNAEAGNAHADVYYAPGYRYFYSISSPNVLANRTTLWDIIQDSCSIPLVKTEIKGTLSSNTSDLTQVSLHPVDSLSIYDCVTFTGYTDINRARAARRFLFMTKIDDNNNNKNKNKDKKPDNQKDKDNKDKDEK
jgi:hypothetical protein